MVLVGIGLVAVMCGLAAHLHRLQVGRHEELYAKARRKYTAVVALRGARGEIYDLGGNLLVGNAPRVDVHADPQLISGEERAAALAAYFAEALGVPEGKILRRLRRKATASGKEIREVVVKNGLSLREAEAVRERLSGTLGLKGILFVDGAERYYPKNELLSNVLGFVNTEGMRTLPVLGIEKAMDAVLAPPAQESAVYERSRRDVPLSYGENHVAAPKPGKDVFLTVVEPIQSIVEEELERTRARWGARAAYAVMVEPRTGSIMALAQRPSFNPNDRQSMEPENWTDRVISSGFEPGSVMKPLIIAAALEMGVVTPGKVYDCEGGHWVYGGARLKDSHPYNLLTVAEIIQKSSNIGTAKIALEMGAPAVHACLRGYGFGQPTGIPLAPEATGILRELKRWDKLSVTRFPIGQGILVSPLQLVRAYCALANGGALPSLRLVDRIRDRETGETRMTPVGAGTLALKNPEAVRQAVEMMKLVTKEGGTATTAAIPGFEVAGKTGTSQKWDSAARSYSTSDYFSTFIGFVPADDPAFVLMVTVDEPRKSHYGGVVAAPAFREIAARTLKYLDIPPDPELIQRGEEERRIMAEAKRAAAEAARLAASPCKAAPLAVAAEARPAPAAPAAAPAEPPPASPAASLAASLASLASPAVPAVPAAAAPPPRPRRFIPLYAIDSPARTAAPRAPEASRGPPAPAVRRTFTPLRGGAAIQTGGGYAPLEQR